MIREEIVLQSAGSFSVAVLALIMAILQIMLLFRKPQFTWYGWSAAISFSAMIYAIGIFIEYNAPAGLLNRFAGKLEYTAMIGLVHCAYGFIFAYLVMDGRHYHVAAGIFHGLVVIFLWSSNYIISDGFQYTGLIGLSRPYVQSDSGPLGPLFMLYVILASIGAIILLISYKGPSVKRKAPYLAGMILWLILGIHDVLSFLGVPTIQYLMEYGFFAFSIGSLWVVFSNFVDISAVDKYRVITEFANDGIMIIQDGKTIFGNPASSALIGRPVTGSSINEFLEVVIQEDRARLMEYYNRLVKSIDYIASLMIHIISAENKERILEINGNRISYRNLPAVLVIIRDVTERIRKEEALKESEEKIARLKKMESLGLLAGGVAHDLNNVLSGIVSYPELILMDLPSDSKLRKPIETMQESGKRSVAIVQDLLTVARGVAVPKESLNLNEVIKGYLSSPEFKKLIQYHEGIIIRKNLDKNLLNIKGSGLHIRKAVMNLVSNASEAISHQGKIIVSSVNRYIDRPLKGYEEVNMGEYAVLTVQDNGPGIASDDLKRIFEPFFTKKMMGRSGTGLGLTLVWNVMQDHEGYIDVTSNMHGTRFELYFPVTRDAVVLKNTPVPLEDLSGHGEMILVIDDVKSQREISCSMLERLGYRAMAVPGGEAAIDYMKENSADLLLLDMIMEPGIDGCETYRRIKMIHPGQKAVIVSGFAETEQVKETLSMGAGRFLKKPLIMGELGRVIKEVLAAHMSDMSDVR
jgi:PAS domain S-box-containing protein